MFHNKKRKNVALPASTLFLTYAANHIVAFLTNGHCKWPHQLAIRFRDTDSKETEEQDTLQADVQVWVDTGTRIGVEFILNITITRVGTGIWSWSGQPIMVTSHHFAYVQINNADNQGSIRFVNPTDEKAIGEYRAKFGFSVPTKFITR